MDNGPATTPKEDHDVESEEEATDDQYHEEQSLHEEALAHLVRPSSALAQTIDYFNRRHGPSEQAAQKPWRFHECWLHQTLPLSKIHPSLSCMESVRLKSFGRICKTTENLLESTRQ
eukprot:253113-Rhodomonas_salina.3